MKVAPTVFSVNDLKGLFAAIVHHPYPVNLRFRTLGQLWYPNFLRIVKMEEGNRVLFHDDERKFFISLRDLSAITEFELNASAGGFEAFTPYQVSTNDIKISKYDTVARMRIG